MPLVAAPKEALAAVFAVQQRSAKTAETPYRAGRRRSSAAPHNGGARIGPYNESKDPARPPALASYQEISAFLAEVERRAFKHAIYALRDEDGALDVVQDAMLKLTEKYSDKPAAELPMLFQRILQNTIHDFFRRRKVRSMWTTVLSALGKGDEKDEDYDPLETLPAGTDTNLSPDPADRYQQAQVMGHVEQALAKLPARQREAFLLRYWEELDVAETALAMGCSEGSVKTHCSRAVQALAVALQAKGVSL